MTTDRRADGKYVYTYILSRVDGPYKPPLSPLFHVCLPSYCIQFISTAACTEQMAVIVKQPQVARGVRET
jgi:hypothetical protein